MFPDRPGEVAGVEIGCRGRHGLGLAGGVADRRGLVVGTAPAN
jgi:hypothetical protein